METQTSRTTDDWKDNEVGYCRELVRTGGDASVPRESVDSYLEVQFASAVRDGRYDVMGAIQTLQIQWRAAIGLPID